MEIKHNAVEIEQSLLGAILVEGKLDKIIGYITPEDFFDSKNAIIYRHLEKMGNHYNIIEISPLIQSLKDSDEFNKVGGEKYISYLLQTAGLFANVSKYIKTIIDKATLRSLNSTINAFQNDIQKTSADPTKLSEKLEMDILNSIRLNKVKEFEAANEIVKKAIQNLNEKLTGETLSGIPSEFTELDTYTGGFQKGDLIILAARPSMGKTALALNIATKVAKKQNVAFFSLEMPAEQLINRVLSFEGMINASKIRDPKWLTSKDMFKLSLAQEKVSKLNLFIDDTSGIKLQELIWKAKRLHKNYPLSIIVIDYLQLIAISNNFSDNRQQEVSAISRALKQLARELEVPIIALSQLSRRVEQRESKIPMMSDLRESGAIEQDADLVAFLYREDYYATKKDEDEESTNKQPKIQVSQIIIGKHRNGPTGTIELVFEPQIGLFADKPKDGKYEN